MINNNEIERFKNLDMQTIEGIADEKLRKQALKLKNKQGGFTLLELLVVVAILAVLGGLAIGAYGDKTTQAARGGATNTIAAVTSMMQAYQATAKVLPSNLDALVCAPTEAIGTPVAHTATNTIDYGGASDLPNVGGGMGAKLGGKLSLAIPGTAANTALINAGVEVVRYAAHDTTLTASSCDGTVVGASFAGADGVFYPVSPLVNADIPNRGFDVPANSSLTATNNRGRGFPITLNATTARAFQIWQRGTNGFNNTKVGAQATDVLAVLGLGNNASMITDSSGNRVGASAPFYGDVAKDKYGRYLALVKIGTSTDTTSDAVVAGAITGFTAASKASFITVVDPRGDFLDEEYAEATGQKS